VQALKKGTGARALRGLIERIMLDVMYDVPKQRGYFDGEDHKERRARRDQADRPPQQDQAAA